MKTISRIFYSMPANCLFFVVLPIFYFLFVLAYDPFHISDFLAVGRERFTLNLIITTLILLGVLSLSRMLLFILRHIIDLNWTLYTIWCVGEVAFAAAMFSILLGIGWAGTHLYLAVLTGCFLYLAGILVFPYAIISMAIQLYIYSKRSTAPAVDEKSLIRFYDDQKRLKLIVSSEAVLYIQAEENYVHIVHMDNGRVKNFTLRSSMRALEEMLSRHGLIRCHRSYFVNSSHVELVKKDVNGFALAQLDQGGISPIPVSKRYYDAVTELL